MTNSLSKRTIADRVDRVASAASVQQAKNPARGPQFLQIVAKPRAGRRARGKPEPKLTRVAFKVSRLMEFCSERELQNQTGHSVYEWPLVVAKETDRQRARRLRGGRGRAGHHGRPSSRTRSSSRTTPAGSTPTPSSRCSTTRSGCRAARPMSRRPGARRATRSRPSSPWATCSIAGSAAPTRRPA